MKVNPVFDDSVAADDDSVANVRFNPRFSGGGTTAVVTVPEDSCGDIRAIFDGGDSELDFSSLMLSSFFLSCSRDFESSSAINLSY